MMIIMMFCGCFYTVRLCVCVYSQAPSSMQALSSVLVRTMVYVWLKRVLVRGVARTYIYMYAVVTFAYKLPRQTRMSISFNSTNRDKGVGVVGGGGGGWHCK